MVAIKIQSKEDIIAAYLQNFGFDKSQLPEVVQSVTAHLDFNSDSGDELVTRIDRVLLDMARRTFPESKLADPQLLAEFKLCFLLCDGATQCSADGMRGLNLPERLVGDMQRQYICNAPPYHYAEMKPQAIESFTSRKRKKK